MIRSDTYWMHRCFSLAVKGNALASPNPMVGAVIVKNGRKIGEGYHEQFGGPHAEVQAIRDARSRRHDLSGATLYVNLEPCSHHGKTPPCADAILQSGITRVVIAVEDPNPLVAGRGIRLLRENGIRCRVGVQKQNAVLLNKFFLKFIRTGMPYVSIKAAQTSDGFIAREDGSSKWITNIRSRRFGHRLRAQYDAVLVGARTVTNDDPELTVRLVKGKNPVRIILDGRVSIPERRKIFSRKAPTLLYTDTSIKREHYQKVRALSNQGVTIIDMKGKNGKLDIREILKDLGRRGISSVLVEGGRSTYTAFLNARCVDTLWLFTSPKKFGTGMKTFEEISVSFRRSERQRKRFAADTLCEYSITFP
jgi:diaminohydroxyphosphoribosylaminopyrimidine deaminase/5-amino-6-(5-phosphoribosylamino)uracil reductase